MAQPVIPWTWGSRLLLIGIVVASGAALAVHTGLRSPSDAKAVDPASLRLASRALRGMDTSEQAAQLVMATVAGARLSAPEQRRFRRGRVGGVILFGENYRGDAQLRVLVRSLQRAVRARHPRAPRLLVAIDQEGGTVRRLPHAPPTRSAPQLGAASDERGAAREGGRTGRALHSLGVNLNLAPVADLDSPPARTMAGRSYGRRGARAGRMAAAFARGLERGGVAGTAKHFPGLGAADINTDLGVAHVRGGRRGLSRHLRPFRTLVDAGVPAVMVSHAIYPAFDRSHPATLSPRIIRGLLRDELGFEGVVVSDALEARGFRQAAHLTPAAACVAAVRAGVDLLIVTAGTRAASACAAALQVAVAHGQLPAKRVREAARRVLVLKARLGLLAAV